MPSGCSRRLDKINVKQPIIQLNENIERMEVKIGVKITDKYDLTRLDNYDLCMKISKQISNFKVKSAECLLTDFTRE
jgi:hypothetical protein